MVRPVVHNRQPVQTAAAYESASSGTRAQSWGSVAVGPNAGVTGEVQLLRQRSRHAYRNNPWVKKGIRSKVTNEVGARISSRSKVAQKEVRDQINSAWKEASAEFDPQGILELNGLYSQIVTARRMSGEVFIRRLIQRGRGSMEVPIQFQVLESDFVPVDWDRDLPNGNIVRSGIEMNSRGRRTAYWMYKSHPSETRRSSIGADPVRIPASEIIHHYFPTRPGQLRGEPDTAQSLVKAFTFNSYDDAELHRKETRAAFTGFIKRDPTVYDLPEDFDISEEEPTSVNSGSWMTGFPGEEPVLFNGDDAGQGYMDVMRMQLMGIAAGMDLPYELLSGDWSSVNDRLVRAILNEFRRDVEAAQMQLLLPQVCDKFWAWWMDAAVLFRKLQLPDYAVRRREYLAVEHSPHAWAYVSPEADVNAKVKELEAGLTSKERIASRRGEDIEEIMDERERDMDREDERGLTPQIEAPDNGFNQEENQSQ